MSTGISATATYKSRNKLAESMLKAGAAFHADDMYSSVILGKNDCANVKNEYKQKLLIFCNLKALYFALTREISWHKNG